MKKILPLILFIGFFLETKAQFSNSCIRDTTVCAGNLCIDLQEYIPNVRDSRAASDYDVNPLSTNSACGFLPPTNVGTPGPTTNITTDDLYSAVIPLGFTFYFYGKPYTSLIVSGNGFVSFDVSKSGAFSHYGILNSGGTLSASAGTPQNLPSTLYDKAIIMGPYHDLDIAQRAANSPTCQIKTEVIGARPHRKFIISYYKLPLFLTTCNNLIENTHQIVLYEGVNIVEVYVNSIQKCMGWNNGRAMIGIQDSSRTKAKMATGRKASDVWGGLNMNESWRFVPKGGVPLLDSVRLYDTSGNLIAYGDTLDVGDGSYRITFPQVCTPFGTSILGDTAIYLMKSWYKNFYGGTGQDIWIDTVRVNKTLAKPTVTSTPLAISGQINACQNSSVAISATGLYNANIRWYSQQTGALLAVSDTFRPNTSVAGNSIYYATQQFGCLESDSTPIRVTINPVPTSPTLTGSSLCGRGIGSITSSPLGNNQILQLYSAATGGTLLFTDSIAYNPVVTSTTTYYGVIKDTIGGCTSPLPRVPVTVTINTLPAAPTTTSANIQRCGSGSVTLTASSATGTTIDWYSQSTGGSVLVGGSGTTTFNTPTISTTTIYYASTRNTTTGCVSARIPITATINPLPNNPTVIGDSRCGTGTLTLTANSGTGETIDWFSASTGGTSIGTGTTFTTPNLTATTTYYAEVKNTTSGCVSAIRTPVIATIITTPNVAIAQNGTRCGPGVVTISATNAAAVPIDWYDAPTAGTLLLSGSNTFTTPTINATTTYYAEVTSASGCVPSRTAVQAVINRIPNPAIGTDNSRCGLGSVTISASAGLTINETIDWYGVPSGGTVLSGGSASNTYTTLPIGLSTIFYAEVRDLTTACVSTIRTPVTAIINTLPNAPVAIGDSKCGGGVLTISATPGNNETINWYNQATGGLLLTNGNIFNTPNITSTTIYYAEAVDNTTGCLSSVRSPATALIIVPPSPAIGIDNKRCGPGSVTISTTVNTNETVDWYATTTGGSILAGGTGSTTFTTPVINSTTVYYAEVRDLTAGCISVIRTPVTAIINQFPNAAIGSDNSRCGVGTLTISASANSGETIDWYNSLIGGSPIGTGLAYTTPSISNTTTYYAEVRNTSTGCVSTIRIPVNAIINNIPNAPVTLGDSKCGPGSLTLTATPGVNETIDWYDQSIGGIFLLNGNTFNTPIISTTTTYFTETRDLITGCLSAIRTPVLAEIITTPNPATAINNERCGPGSINISALVGNNETIDWYNTSTGGSILANGSSTTTYTTPAITSTTTYYAEVRSTSAAGCVSLIRTPVLAVINIIPNPPIAINNAKCGPGSVSIAANVNTGETVDWYAQSTSGNILINGSGVTTYNTTTIINTTTYYAETRNLVTACVSNIRTAVIATINSLPDIGIDTVKKSICFRDSIDLTTLIDTTGYSSHIWKLGNDIIYNPENIKKTGLYKLVVSNSLGCLDSAFINLIILPPVNAFAGNDTTAVLGQPHQLMGSGGTNYIWTPTTPITSSANIQYPTVVLNRDQIFYLMTENIAGCKGYDTVFVKVYDQPNYYVPNSFTPNADGLNDIFRAIPAGIASTEYFRIYDRYGKLIFETNRFMRGWDGNFQGRKQPNGTYVWIVKGTDKFGNKIEKKGTVILIR